MGQITKLGAHAHILIWVYGFLSITWSFLGQLTKNLFGNTGDYQYHLSIGKEKSMLFIASRLFSNLIFWICFGIGAKMGVVASLSPKVAKSRKVVNLVH